MHQHNQFNTDPTAEVDELTNEDELVQTIDLYEEAPQGDCYECYESALQKIATERSELHNLVIESQSRQK